MSYCHAGSVSGREVFLWDEPDPGDMQQPQGYSIAAVVLREGWKSDELGSLLNQLYGGIGDWTDFDPNAGARSFVFYGDRAEEASNLCDAFAYAWTRGAQAQYNDVIAASNDAADIPAFVEAVFFGEVSVGDSYADELKNTIFAALVSDEETQDDLALIHQVQDAVQNAVRQHHFD